MFGNLEGAVRSGKKKEWTDCVLSDIRAFGIARDWKATALKAEVEEKKVDAARHRQEKREERRILRSHPHWPSRRVE